MAVGWFVLAEFSCMHIFVCVGGGGRNQYEPVWKVFESVGAIPTDHDISSRLIFTVGHGKFVEPIHAETGITPNADTELPKKVLHKHKSGKSTCFS